MRISIILVDLFFMIRFLKEKKRKEIERLD